MSDEIKECSHCWHNRGEWTDTGGHHRSKQCCHCGVFVQEKVEYNPFGIGYGSYTLPKHGPHEPRPIVGW